MAEQKALVVVDVQAGFDEPVWGRRNNPQCERNIETLILHWRAEGGPLVYVRHDSVQPDSPLRPGQPGNALRSIVSGEPDLLVTKSVNSAFYGQPDLHEWLQGRSIDGVVICGVQTNYCCETTARMAGNLGYDTYFALDATHTFDMLDLDGGAITAEELTRVTAANLDGEFARVVETAQLVAGT
ncbi:MAG: cysteine hydrolase family protein [Acidimicrobiia bacterium]